MDPGNAELFSRENRLHVSRSIVLETKQQRSSRTIHYYDHKGISPSHNDNILENAFLRVPTFHVVLTYLDSIVTTLWFHLLQDTLKWFYWYWMDEGLTNGALSIFEWTDDVLCKMFIKDIIYLTYFLSHGQTAIDYRVYFCAFTNQYSQYRSKNINRLSGTIQEVVARYIYKYYSPCIILIWTTPMQWKLAVD